MTLNKEGRIDLISLEDIIKKYSTNQSAPTLSGTFQIMANRIHKKANGASIEDFFLNRFNWEYHASIDFTDFMTKMTKILDLTKEEVREAFEALDISQQNKITCNELIFTLKSYLQAAQGPNLDLLNVADLIQGYAEMTPRSGLAALIKEMKTSLAAKSTKFSMIWNFTKKPEDLKKQKNLLQSSFNKCVDDISEELVQEVMKQMPMTAPTKEEFLTFFGEKEEIKRKKKKRKKKIQAIEEGKPVPKESSKSEREKAKEEKEEKMNEKTRSKWIAKYSKLLDNNEITSENAFERADKDGSKAIDLDELKAALKIMMPADKLSYNDIAQMMNAFDTDGDGQITEEEYFAQVERTKGLFEDQFEEIDFGDQALPDQIGKGTSTFLPTKNNLETKEIKTIHEMSSTGVDE